MSTGRRPWAIAVFVVVTFLYLGATALHFMSGGGFDLNLMLLPVLYAFAVVGVLIALHQPGNRIAWVCFGTSLFLGLEGVGWGVAIYELTHPGTVPNYALWAVIGDSLVLPGVFAMLTLVLLWFPDGRLPSPRWKWVELTAFTLIVLVFVIGLFGQERSGWGRPHVDNPLAPRQGSPFGTLMGSDTLDLLVLLLLFVSVAGSVAALLVRYRRSEGVERQQLKWFVFASSVLIASFVPAIFLADYLGDDFGLAAGALFILIPISIGIAILRYRLYEIDRLISRTVTYVLLAGGVGLVFGALAVGLPQLAGLPEDNPLPVAVATLVVAALFNPLRRRVKDAVDRRFNRAHYDLESELDEFAQRLHGQMSVEDISTEVLEVVTSTMQPVGATVWIKGNDGAPGPG